MTRRVEHAELAGWDQAPPVGAGLHDRGLPPVKASEALMAPDRWPATRYIWRHHPEHADELLAMLLDPMNPNGRTEHARANPEHPANRRPT